MILYTILPIHKKKTGHYIIDDPKKPAHEEVFSSVPIYIIEEKPGGVFLNKYDEDGVWIGDTWHQTIEGAKEQAEYSYKHKIEEWKELPKDILTKEDALKYILNILENNK